MVAKKYTSLNSKEPRFGAVFMTNFSIFWICICLVMQLISLGTNEWYVKKDAVIKYWHGGLWNICLGEIDRTLCSYNRNNPTWLKVTQSMLLISLCLMFVNIVYIMVGIARKVLRVSVMMGIANATTFFFIIGVTVYTVCGYPTNVKPGKTFTAAWATTGLLLFGCFFSFLAFLRVSKISKKKSVETGIKL